MHERHHDLCFGCGLANPFGLQLETAMPDDRRLEGRFFVKQDHQGAPGRAHPGVITAALVEAMTLCAQALRREATLTGLELRLLGPAQVGTFVEVAAKVVQAEDDGLRIEAQARGEAGIVARAHGLFAGGYV
jgi:acyl-coenzyme A thioesterase PaaI-like protein